MSVSFLPFTKKFQLFNAKCSLKGHTYLHKPGVEEVGLTFQWIPDAKVLTKSAV